MDVTSTDDGTHGTTLSSPSEAQLRRDIRHFERQIARLACPSSIWEQGALKCYRVLVSQRRKMLDEVRAVEGANVRI